MDEKTMQSSLERFFQMASQDLELQSKLKAASDREAYINLVVELGQEKGYSFTKEQVTTALDAAESEAASDGESESQLSQEELDAVAGGCGNTVSILKPAGVWFTRLRSCTKSS